MSAISNIVLNNGAATPVAKTFVPVQKFGGAKQPAVWKLKEGSSPLAWCRVEITETRTSRGSRRVEYKILVPYVADVDGVPTLVSTALFDSRTGGFIIPDTAVQSQIDDLYAFAKNLAAHAVMDAWVCDQDPAF
jgi:hypothetical protein